MYHIKEVIDIKQAAQILNCSTANVYRLIKIKTITTAFKGYADGHVGQPGWRMYRDEIEGLTLPGKSGRKESEKKIDKPKPEAKKVDNKNVKAKKALGDLKAALELLIEAIGELEEEL